ncbi:Sir2 family NAD-dependent protein deacetylase [Corynebacterium tapiri]|uniref:protein acetyllysine N-acetyltransferase n=1 Tax=Corynebacterium tapiri TaxID=1448266 RepID=A0A5C4U2U1_9CORY|nr:Sir2 family NAD-dependent protein deacetylase [Corynebacterium tapiri]TNL96818.1 NAD-dependent protein deacetylase [Corynebacterium tapiri]
MSAFDDPAVAQAHASALRSIARVVEEKITPVEAEVAAQGVEKLFERGRAMVLTGAGVSTDSGIPDYRGESGKWKTTRPMTFQEFRHDPAAVHRYWARAFVGWRAMRTAQPNQTHHLLADLERAGRITGVVTQNVDGLHQQAGSRNLVTLHGDMSQVVCLDCGAREERSLLDARSQALNPNFLESIRLDESMVNPDGDVELPAEAVQRFVQPGCLRCGSLKIKPDVTYFGEPVSPERRQRARELAEEADFLLVMGSSLAVMSGYLFVIEARRAGRPVAVINGGPGRADDKVDVVWRTDLAAATRRLRRTLLPG